MPPRGPPASTYRVQLSRSFDLDALRRIVPYLGELGIDAVYLSPLAAARPGSPHGYDGIDPGRIDRDRGGPAGFRRLARCLHRHGMGLLLDVVPNHLAASLDNRAFAHVLAHGPRCRFAGFFDIDWSRTPEARPAIVLPWLDRSVGRAFAEGALAFEAGAQGLQALCLGRRRIPVSASARTLFRRLARPESRRAGRFTRRRDGERRADLLARINRPVGEADRALRDRLLGAQWYRLVPWWDFRQINYRRFFDISDLVGIRVDDPRVFAYMHRWLRTAAGSSAFRGVRIDHIDGLADPAGYLRRLQCLLREVARTGRSPYIVVEKILGPDEELPRTWPIGGTTGYDILGRITGVLIPPGAAGALAEAYRRVCPPELQSFRHVAYQAKREVIDTLFPGELAAMQGRLHAAGPPARPAVEEREGIAQLTAALGVYRTYARSGRLGAQDRRRVRRAFSIGERQSAPGDRRRLRRLRRSWPGLSDGPLSPAAAEFIVRWQQWTGAVAAKGVEDTAFYRYARYLGVNEVGSDPGQVGVGLSEFHAWMIWRQRRWPHALSATSTHDTKWGEDARARLIALAEWAEPWARTVRRWVHGRAASAEEYRLYQTLVATAPVDGRYRPGYLRRLETHVVKAAREAKQATSWVHPDAGQEARLQHRVRRLLSAAGHAGFRRELERWVRRLDYFGRFYSVGQAVLRTTLPGVPDLYQGSEGWNLSLVDPDNRNAVPYAQLAQMLRAAQGRGFAPSWPSAPRDPGAWRVREADKLAVTARLLRFRREHRALFDSGSYLPVLEVTAGSSASVLAFARRAGPDWLLVVVGRGLARVSRGERVPPVGPAWGQRAIGLPRGAPESWQPLLTPGRLTVPRTRSPRQLPLSGVFERWPVAVLFHGAGRPTNA